MFHYYVNIIVPVYVSSVHVNVMFPVGKCAMLRSFSYAIYSVSHLQQSQVVGREYTNIRYAEGVHARNSLQRPINQQLQQQLHQQQAANLKRKQKSELPK